MQKAIGLITDIILVALNGLHVLSFYYLYFQILYENDPGIGISSVYISSSVLIAFVLMTVYSIKFVWQDVTGSGKEEK